MTRRMVLGSLLLPFLAIAQDAHPDFGAEIAALAQKAPIIQRARFGFKVVDLQTGQVLAQQNAANFFTPASNVKLYTTAFALLRLGPDYRFQTELRTSGSWHPGQTSLGDLQFIGGGDPNLSGRVLPYAVNSESGDPLSAIRDLASKLCEAGVREITGDVTGVATRYGRDLYPDGWTIDDANYGYGAPVSSLVVNDSIVSISVTPGQPGELATVETDPAFDHFVILNQVLTDTSDQARLQIARPAGSNELILSGAIGIRAAGWKQDVAVEDPALFASEALIESLRQDGVVVRGSPAAQYCSSDSAEAASNSCAVQTGAILAVHQSPPLWQAVQVTNKTSQNLHAEMLLRETSYADSGSGTLAAAVAAREDFLKTIGVSPDNTGFSLADGSGLARQDLTTPDSTVTLLQSMWQSPVRDAWVASLPVGGVDGSLQHRFHNMVAADHVHAKTGSISHVSSLSGYIETQKHGWLAFSIMVNAAVGDNGDVRTFLDSFCGLFLGY